MAKIMSNEDLKNISGGAKIGKDLMGRFVVFFTRDERAKAISKNISIDPSAPGQMIDQIVHYPVCTFATQKAALQFLSDVADDIS